MTGRQSRSSRNILGYVACYGIWLLLAVLGAYVALVWREAGIAMAARRWNDVWSVTLTDQLVTIFLALGWLVFIMVLEPYLRSGLASGQFWSRAAKVLAIEVVLLVLVYFV